MTNKIFVKNKIIANLIKNGNRKTCEKKIFKLIKYIQKENQKNHIDIIISSIKNNLTIIKLKEMKQKKRKSKKYLPYVLAKNDRINSTIKNIIKNVSEKPPIIQSLKKEFILSSKNESTLKEKIELNHTAAILKKRYSRFRWFY